MRYAIPESVDDAKYSITFTTVPYDPDTNLQAEAMENDPEFRQLVFLQMQEKGELSSRHSMERVRYLAKRRRILRPPADSEPVEPEPDPAKCAVCDTEIGPFDAHTYHEPDCPIIGVASDDGTRDQVYDECVCDPGLECCAEHCPVCLADEAER